MSRIEVKSKTKKMEIGCNAKAVTVRRPKLEQNRIPNSAKKS